MLLQVHFSSSTVSVCFFLSVICGCIFPPFVLRSSNEDCPCHREDIHRVEQWVAQESCMHKFEFKYDWSQEFVGFEYFSGLESEFFDKLRCWHKQHSQLIFVLRLNKIPDIKHPTKLFVFAIFGPHRQTLLPSFCSLFQFLYLPNPEKFPLWHFFSHIFVDAPEKRVLRILPQSQQSTARSEDTPMHSIFLLFPLHFYAKTHHAVVSRIRFTVWFALTVLPNISRRFLRVSRRFRSPAFSKHTHCFASVPKLWSIVTFAFSSLFQRVVVSIRPQDHGWRSCALEHHRTVSCAVRCPLWGSAPSWSASLWESVHFFCALSAPIATVSNVRRCQ